MTAEEQVTRKRRLRDAEVMEQVIRAEKEDDLGLAQVCIQWDEDDEAFVKSTRLGRLIWKRFSDIPLEQIKEWQEAGDLWGR